MVSSLPPIIAGAAIYRLVSSKTLPDLTSAFFELEIPDQISLLSLLFASVFSAVSISGFIAPPGHNDDDDEDEHKPPFQYPLKEIASKTTDKEKFLSVYPCLRDSIAEYFATKHEMVPEGVNWITEMIDYSCVGGKMNRGITVLTVARTLSGSSGLTPREEARASVVGWGIEFLQAFFLVADDLMDDSKTRRGQPCWYLLPKVGTIAVNDSFLLESFVFTFLKEHFGKEPYYIKLVELFLETIQQTECGQLLDLTSQPKDAKTADLSRFTIERYRKIVKYKTAFYSFYLPVASAMLMSGVTNSKSFKTARNICCIMGEYFQIQDDVLDCYGTPEVIGKVGTDIQDNKCSWLIVQALDRATPEQRKVIEENYGKWDDAKVAKIKAIYNEMGLKSVFEKYEEDSYAEIQEELKKINDIPQEVFTLFLDKIYKRSK
uniref:Farnesyl pyrophosphate synthase n=1 Tax=Sundstroemia setigera TaxID=3005 RepID=A0A0G2T690_9STRA|nr:farnesyl pyrophosphate synthase [Rhizosolenia setigera]